MSDFFRVLGAGTRFRAADKAVLSTTSASTGTATNGASLKRKLQKEAAAELDFFGTTTTSTTSSGAAKRQKEDKDSYVEEEEEEEEDDEAHQQQLLVEEDHDNNDDEAVSLDTEEQLSLFRKRYRIKVTGSDVPKPLVSFEALVGGGGVHKFLGEALVAAKYTKPTPVQRQAMPVLLAKRELLAIAPTGSGKTLSYVLPMLQQLRHPKKSGLRGLVIVPTRELAQQIYREFKKLSGDVGFRLCVLTKSVAGSVQQSPELKQKFDVLISTPLRLVSLIQENAMDLSKVEMLVMDEGDRLLDLGFVQQVDEILAACSNPSLVRCLFSATLPEAIETLVRTVMHDPIRLTIGQRNTTAETVKQRLVFVGNEQGKLLAIRQLVREGLKPPVLVFVQSIERAKELFHELVYDGINVDVIHSERMQSQRDNIVANFRAGRIWFLIATELLSRGMDFKGISTVINYDFPQTTVSYIHRIGRAGRAGRQGEAVTLFTQDDAVYLRGIANVMKDSGCDVPDWMLALKKNTKKERRQLARSPVERESISTAPDAQKHKKKYVAGKKPLQTNKTKTSGASAATPK